MCHDSYCHQSNCGAELLPAQPQHSHNVPHHQICKYSLSDKVKCVHSRVISHEDTIVIFYGPLCRCSWKWSLASSACPLWWMRVTWRQRWTACGSGGAAPLASCREQRNMYWNSLAVKWCLTNKERGMVSQEQLVRCLSNLSDQPLSHALFFKHVNVFMPSHQRQPLSGHYVCQYNPFCQRWFLSNFNFITSGWNVNLN